MTKFALEILDDKNLPTFKKNALSRAKEFELSKILPEYVRYYKDVLEQTSSTVSA